MLRVFPPCYPPATLGAGDASIENGWMEYRSREAKQTEHILISRFILRCQTNSETRRRVSACMKCMDVAIRFIFFLINILIRSLCERIIGARSYNCFLFIHSRQNAKWWHGMSDLLPLHLMFFCLFFKTMVHLIYLVLFSVAEPLPFTNTYNINGATFALFSADWSRTLTSVGSPRSPLYPCIFQT